MTPTDVLALSPVFASLKPEERARLVSHAREHRVEEGEHLCRVDEPATTLWCLVEGEVRIGSTNGDRHMVTSGVFGEEAGLGLPHYLADAVAETPCTLLAVSGEAVRRILDDDQERHRGSEAAYRPVLERWSRAAGKALAPKGVAGRNPFILSLGWTLSVVLPALVLRWGPTLELGWGQLHFLVALTAGGVLWAFSLVPPVVAVMVPMTLALLLGVVDPAVMLGGFGSRVFFMVLSIYGVAIPIVNSGVITRGALHLLRLLPRTPAAQELGLFLGGVLLTPVIPSPERRVRTLAPLAADLHGGGEPRGTSRLILAAVLGTTLFTPVFLSSAPLNFVIYGLLAEQVQVELPWLRWAAAASVVGLVLLIGYPLIMKWLFRGVPRPAATTSVQAQLDLLGPMKLTEWIALLGGVVFIFASATPAFHQVDPRLVALTIFSLYVMVRVVTHHEINLQIDWSFLLFLGAFLGISITASAIQVDRILLEQFTGLRTFMRTNPQTFLLLAVSTALILGRYIPMSAAFVAFFAMTMAAVNGMNTWVVGFTILVAGESWFMRSGTPIHRMVERFTADDPAWDRRRLVQLGVGLALLRILAILASIPFWTHREML